MRVLDRYLAHEVYASTALVFTGLLLLFAFFDLIGELADLGRGGYRLSHIFGFVLLSLPGHVYELFPIAALIGAMFALAQLVASSEFTVMRTSGVSVPRIVISLLKAGLVFALLVFVFGEFIAPPAERAAQQLRLKALNSMVAQEFRSGLWVRDGTSFINVREVLPDSSLLGVRIYEFDQEHRLRAISVAERGTHVEGDRWLLSDIARTSFEGARTVPEQLEQAVWQSALTPELVSVLLVSPEQMSAWDLYFYVGHLEENRQKTARYEIALWSKLTYPFAALVMLLLALPFSMRHARAGGVSAKVFAGIMLGLVFHLTNRVFSHLGLLYDWAPALSAVMPTVLFLAVAMTAMWWLERR